ncbi:uncharacterized protein LOC124262707 [Haliotis rubra]|uniref:uncharacterized protein LOC124262707 n=1 Tax=Haliotis rubra TaxID=36100 RepID=UPI001EE612EE|nr:uncharacterized protein LOC124262707 [Haliotis rubra]
MDTLLNLSDNEIENISLDDELVLFDRIKKYYSPTCDLRVSYLLGEAVVASSYDWVGLYRPGWASTSAYLSYQWAPVQAVSAHAPRRRRVVVPRSSWSNYQNEDKLQLLYVSASGDVIGVSCSFRIGEPEEPDLNFNVLERPQDTASSVSVVESFSNNFVDLETISLLSESDSGNSSPSDLDVDVDPPVNVAWDCSTLSGDFTGKSWLEELELLPDNTIVKEYEPVKDRCLVPYMPVLLKDFSGTPKTYQPITDVKDRRSYSIFFDEDADEEGMSLLFKKDGLNTPDEAKKVPLPKTAVSEYLPIECAIKKLYEEISPQHPQDKGSSIALEEECIPLLSDDDLTLSDVPLDSTKSPTEVEVDGCPPTLFSDEDAFDKVMPLYSVDEGRTAVAVFSTEKKKRAKQEKIRKAIEILHGLIRLIPSTSLPRPLGCAPDCAGCVVSQGILSHYHQRFLAAEEDVQKLKEEVQALQKSLDAKDAAIISAKDHPSPILMSSLSNVMGMVRYVQRTNETNALLDQALTVTLAEKHQLEKGQITSSPESASEKGQQTEVKVVRDESTECLTSPQGVVTTDTCHFEDEEQDGWNRKNSRKIDRLKRTIVHKEEDLETMQDKLSGQQVQIIMFQDTIKELRKNVREERRLAKTARQEVLALRRQVSAMTSSRKRLAWGGHVTSKDVGVSMKPQTATVGTESRYPRRHTFGAQVYPKPRFMSGVSAFFPERKAFREDMNMQIRTGKCRTCGMRFSPTVDRRLIEEHITFHLQFHM